MKIRVEKYADGTAALFLDERAHLYLLALRGANLREVRSGREWCLQFGHPNDARAFVKQFMPPYVREVKEPL